MLNPVMPTAAVKAWIEKRLVPSPPMSAMHITTWCREELPKYIPNGVGGQTPGKNAELHT